jgi:penicillin amidase
MIPRIGSAPFALVYGEHTLTLTRTTGGVGKVVVGAGGEEAIAALAYGTGFLHVHDRAIQMFLLRTIGQGRLCEQLQDSPETLPVDKFMREVGFAHELSAEVELLTASQRRGAQAYCDGVNAYLERYRRPAEFVLLGVKPEPWRIEDCLLTGKVMAYIGLAQSQQDFEKLLIEAIQGGVDVPRLRRLLQPHLDGLDDEILAAIRAVEVCQPFTRDLGRFMGGVPAINASNSWVVGPERSQSGAAIHCNDPHLECNRLPGVWYEATLHCDDNDWVGATMPGVPGLVMGRSRRLAFGFTYGFMDQVDYVIERVEAGQLARPSGTVAPTVRVETIKRKKHPDVELPIYSSEHGILELPLDRTAGDGLEDGLYLSRLWSGQTEAGALAVGPLLDLQGCRTVAEAQEVVRAVSISANWTLSDADGNIGYQQSGRFPRRAHSGLHPQLGWREGAGWDGFHDPAVLTSVVNPPEGYVASANNDIGLFAAAGAPLTVNMCQGEYRRDRIAALIEAKEKLEVSDVLAMQRDLYSTQARLFWPRIEPHLDDSAPAALLRDWDLRYGTESVGAPIFERVYEGVLRAAFGGLFGEEIWTALMEETALLPDYFPVFDRAILDDDPWIFGSEQARIDAFAQAVSNALAESERRGPVTWGELQTIDMVNILFDGKLPAFLGFDRMRVPLPGCRSTLVQGSVFRAHGRPTSFFPSWRFVADFASGEVQTILAGGPSARRFSGLYIKDVADWLSFRYKTLKLAP